MKYIEGFKFTLKIVLYVFGIFWLTFMADIILGFHSNHTFFTAVSYHIHFMVYWGEYH